MPLAPCAAGVPLWACDVGRSAGYASTAFWFMVLAPQIYQNYRRRSTRGLSWLWACANFTASLVNSFFVFRLRLPLYSRIMAVYMPVLEAVIILQMVAYRPPPSGDGCTLAVARRRRRAIYCGAVLGWCGIAAVEMFLPQWTSSLQWIATVLWCLETFPQLALNAKLRTGSGQAPLSVATTVAGKTTDMLSAFLVAMPVQVHVLCFFSSSTAYIDALQVMWYVGARRGVSQPAAATSVKVIPGLATESHHHSATGKGVGDAGGPTARERAREVQPLLMATQSRAEPILMAGLARPAAHPPCDRDATCPTGSRMGDTGSVPGEPEAGSHKQSESVSRWVHTVPAMAFAVTALLGVLAAFTLLFVAHPLAEALLGCEIITAGCCVARPWDSDWARKAAAWLKARWQRLCKGGDPTLLSPSAAPVGSRV